MTFELFLARRFLTGERFGVFRLVTTFIAIGGTALGVAALLVTLAVMDGFRTDIQEKILGTQPHLVITHPLGAPMPEDPALASRMAGQSGVQALSPFLYAQSLIQSGSSVTGILVRGIAPSQENTVTHLFSLPTVGSWNGFGDRNIALGQELAQSVGARVGDTVTLIAPQSSSAAWGQMPRMRRYTVAAIFRSGMYEYDANLAYLTLDGARALLGYPGEITGYGVRLDRIESAPDIARTLQKTVARDLWVRSWQDMNRNLFSAMKLERTVMFLILTLLILVSSFTIISNLLLLTLEKAREIGILQALGASPRQIARIFFLHGLMLGGSGVGLGLALGIGISSLLKRYPIIRLPADVYYVDRLPIRLSAGTIESVAVCAFLLVLASILYPARTASRMDPVQAIRYG